MPPANRLRLSPSLQILLAPQMHKVLVPHREIRCKHAGCDFVAIGAVTDESAHQAGRLRGLVLASVMSNA
jgi:hypothetical protein